MNELPRLKELRTNLKLSQTVFADKIGMLQQQYSRYETGERELQLKHLKRICTEFDVTADWLLGLSDKKERE